MSTALVPANIIRPDNNPNGYALSPFLLELIRPLAVQHPDWLFEMRPSLSSVANSNDTLTPIKVNCIHVHVNATPREYIGRIRTSERRGVECYSITNRHVQASRQRGENIVTGRLKVALQAVKRYFIVPPVEERIAKLVETAIPRLQMHKHGKRRRMEDAKGEIDNELQEFLATHWSMFIGNLPTDKQQLAEAYLNATQEYGNTTQVVDAAQEKKIVTVLTVEDNYVVQFGGVIKTMRSEELDPELRHRIGTLKLMEQGSVVPGVGFRSQADFFMVLPPEDFSI